MEGIVNKIQNSGLLTIDLEDFYPEEKRIIFDIKDYLYEGLILKEKDFRQALSELDLSVYKDAYVAVDCSADAIIPSWAYLLVSSTLANVAKLISFGGLEDLERDIYAQIINNLEIEGYQDKKVIIKGCSHKPVPQNAYLQLLQKLKPVVSSLMFGEACSTVPIYKKKKQ